MLRQAGSRPDIATEADDWNTDPWMLNCLNGTVDLRTGELRPHDREDLIDHQVGYGYDPAASCPTWERFLSEVLVTEDGKADEELISWVQRSVGYSITGNVSDHAIWFLYGGGSNGKSVFLATLLALTGDLGLTVESDLLMAKRNEGGPNPSIVKLEESVSPSQPKSMRAGDSRRHCSR